MNDSVTTGLDRNLRNNDGNDGWEGNAVAEGGKGRWEKDEGRGVKRRRYSSELRLVLWCLHITKGRFASLFAFRLSFPQITQ